MTVEQQMQLEAEQVRHQSKMHYSGAWSQDFLSFDDELELAERNEELSWESPYIQQIQAA